MKIVLSWVAAGLGLVTAGLWLKSAMAKVEYDPDEKDEDGLYPFAMTEKEGPRTVDILKTAAEQTRWNKWAAAFGAAAAGVQAVSMFLPD